MESLFVAPLGASSNNFIVEFLFRNIGVRVTESLHGRDKGRVRMVIGCGCRDTVFQNASLVEPRLKAAASRSQMVDNTFLRKTARLLFEPNPDFVPLWFAICFLCGLVIHGHSFLHGAHERTIEV